MSCLTLPLKPSFRKLLSFSELLSLMFRVLRKHFNHSSHAWQPRLQEDLDLLHRRRYDCFISWICSSHDLERLRRIPAGTSLIKGGYYEIYRSGACPHSGKDRTHSPQVSWSFLWWRVLSQKAWYLSSEWGRRTLPCYRGYSWRRLVFWR